MAEIPMTYEALAERLGINTASARRLALRKRWRKAPGNDGKAIVYVPEEFLSSRPTDDPETVLPPVVPSPEVAVLTAQVSMLEGRIEELKADVERERKERQEERERADRLAHELADLARRASESRGFLSWLLRK